MLSFEEQSAKESHLNTRACLVGLIFGSSSYKGALPSIFLEETFFLIKIRWVGAVSSKTALASRGATQEEPCHTPRSRPLTNRPALLRTSVEVLAVVVVDDFMFYLKRNFHKPSTSYLASLRAQRIYFQAHNWRWPISIMDLSQQKCKTSQQQMMHLPPKYLCNGQCILTWYGHWRRNRQYNTNWQPYKPMIWLFAPA